MITVWQGVSRWRKRPLFIINGHTLRHYRASSFEYVSPRFNEPYSQMGECEVEIDDNVWVADGDPQKEVFQLRSGRIVIQLHNMRRVAAARRQTNPIGLDI